MASKDENTEQVALPLHMLGFNCHHGYSSHINRSLERSRLSGRERESKGDSDGPCTVANASVCLVLERITRDDASRTLILDTDSGVGHHCSEYRG